MLPAPRGAQLRPYRQERAIADSLDGVGWCGVSACVASHRSDLLNGVLYCAHECCSGFQPSDFLLTVSCLKCSKRVDNIAGQVTMPAEWAIDGAHSDKVPSLFVVNCQV